MSFPDLRNETSFLKRLLKNLLDEGGEPPRPPTKKLPPLQMKRLPPVQQGTSPKREHSTTVVSKTKQAGQSVKMNPPPRDDELPVSKRKKANPNTAQNSAMNQKASTPLTQPRGEGEVSENAKIRQQQADRNIVKEQVVPQQKKVKKKKRGIPKTIRKPVDSSVLNDSLEKFLSQLERSQDNTKKWKVGVPENPYFAEFDIEDINLEINNDSILEEVGTCSVILTRDKNVLIGTSLGFILQFVHGELNHVFGSLELSIYGKNVTALDVYREHFILSGFSNGVMIIWDLRTGKSVLEVSPGLSALLSVKFLNHKTFLFCDSRGKLQIFNCESGNFTDLSTISPENRILTIEVATHNTVFLLNTKEVIVLEYKGKGLSLIQRIPLITPTTNDHIPYISSLGNDIFERKIIIGYSNYFRIYKYQQSESRYVMIFHYNVPMNEEVVSVNWLTDAVFVITQLSEAESWDQRTKKFYVIDRFDDTQNYVEFSPSDGYVIDNFDINFGLIGSTKQLFHNFSDVCGNNVYCRGKEFLYCFNFDSWRLKLRKHFQKNQWRKGFELGCFNFFHGLSVIFNIPKKQITDYLVPNIQRYIHYVLTKEKSEPETQKKKEREEEEEENEGEIDSEDEEEVEDEDISVACENCFTYLIHIERLDYIFNELYELMSDHKIVYYDALFRQMEKEDLKKIPIRLLDEFFEHGKRILDFEKILMFIDITENPEMIDKLIEKCQVHEDYYGCYVSVYAKGKGNFLTPLRFLISQPKHSPKVRQEIIQILKLALSLRPAYAPDVLGLIFKDALTTVLSSPKTCQVFLNLFFDMVHRLRLLRRSVYDMYVHQLINSIDIGASTHDARTDELYLLLAKLIDASHIRLKDKHLLERVSDYLLTPRENPSLDERQRLLSSLFEKTHPLFQDKYAQYIQHAKGVKMHGIVVQLCRKSGNSAEILRNLFVQLADRRREDMKEDIDFLLNFRERVQWVYDELRTKISETSGVGGDEKECQQSKRFLEMFLARVMDDPRAGQMLRPIVLADPDFHLSYMELLVECQETDRVMIFLKKHYGTTLNHIKSEDLFRVCQPVSEARLFLFAKAGNIQELLKCVLKNVKGMKINLMNQLQQHSPNLEKSLALELKKLIESSDIGDDDVNNEDEDDDPVNLEEIKGLKHPVFCIQYYKFMIELDEKLEGLSFSKRKKKKKLDDSFDDDDDDNMNNGMDSMSIRTPEFNRTKKHFEIIRKANFVEFFKKYCPEERYPHVMDFDFTSVANVKLLLPFEEEDEERIRKGDRLPLPKFGRDLFPSLMMMKKEEKSEDQEVREENDQTDDEDKDENNEQEEQESKKNESSGDNETKEEEKDGSDHIENFDDDENNIIKPPTDQTESEEERKKKLLLDVLEIPYFEDLRFTIQDSIKYYLKPSSASIEEKLTLQRFWFEFLDQSVLIPLLELRYSFLFEKVPPRKERKNYDFDDDDSYSDDEEEKKKKKRKRRRRRTKKRFRMNEDGEEELEVVNIESEDFGGDISDDYITDSSTSDEDSEDDDDGEGGRRDSTDENKDELGNTYRKEFKSKRELESLEEQFEEESEESKKKEIVAAIEEKKNEVEGLRHRIETIERKMREGKVRAQKEKRKREKQFDEMSKLTNLYLQRSYLSLLQLILDTMKEYIEVPLILKKLVVDYSFEKFIHLKRMVYLLLYDFDENILLTRKTKSLLSEDILTTFNSYYITTNHGLITRKKSCCRRNCLMKDKDSEKLITFRCGHIFHFECLESQQLLFCNLCSDDVKMKKKLRKMRYTNRPHVNYNSNTDDTGNAISGPQSSSLSAQVRKRKMIKKKKKKYHQNRRTGRSLSSSTSSSSEEESRRKKVDKNKILFSKKIEEWEEIFGKVEISKEEIDVCRNVQRGLKKVTLGMINIYDKYNL